MIYFYYIVIFCNILQYKYLKLSLFFYFDHLSIMNINPIYLGLKLVIQVSALNTLFNVCNVGIL